MQHATSKEMERLLALMELEIDYSDFQNHFSDLARLAAKVAGTDISLINLIDAYTQWTVSSHGLKIEQLPREDSICHYTIQQEQYLEINDLTADDRFSDKDYVKEEPHLSYYLGIPLQASGCNIGTLCVLDPQHKPLSPEKLELLKIIAEEVVQRLQTMKDIDMLKQQLKDISGAQLKVAHDIRGPLGGIIGIAEYIHAQGGNTNTEEIIEMMQLIASSGNSLLEMADDILSRKIAAPEEPFTLQMLESKLIQLYLPQARNKNITLTVSSADNGTGLLTLKNKLLQICGNLISNAIKFTPQGGAVSVLLHIVPAEHESTMLIQISDNGPGISPAQIEQIASGKAESTTGTSGETGFGFGLPLVQQLVASLGGNMQVVSDPEQKGAQFTITLPIHKQ
ncbi:GAF domain-containing sensor histidine kinase [Rurimicrobium arvi]|uniref:histidine kinase n=1 Tax=Rurimicrobium arvi TaxID=2049916 RepID=A0ABP8MWM8_9BACT